MSVAPLVIALDSSTTGSNFFGEPRNFLATARYKF